MLFHMAKLPDLQNAPVLHVKFADHILTAMNNLTSLCSLGTRAINCYGDESPFQEWSIQYVSSAESFVLLSAFLNLDCYHVREQEFYIKRKPTQLVCPHILRIGTSGSSRLHFPHEWLMRSCGACDHCEDCSWGV